MNSESEGEEQFLNSAPTVSGLTGGQRVLGRYRLEKVLGAGGMGIVWLAHDEQLDRDVALKFLPDMVLNDRASLKHLKNEMLRTLELTHPNIVRTYDLIQDSKFTGISMEYVDGDTLRNLQVDVTALFRAG
jgi:serine/threonine protein kinase